MPKDRVVRYSNFNIHQENFVLYHDVVKWKYFPRYWPFVRGIHRSPVNSPHTEIWSFLSASPEKKNNGKVNKADAGDLRRHRAHYDVTVMAQQANYFTTLCYKDTCKKWSTIWDVKIGQIKMVICSWDVSWHPWNLLSSRSVWNDLRKVVSCVTCIIHLAWKWYMVWKTDKHWLKNHFYSGSVCLSWSLGLLHQGASLSNYEFRYGWS